MLDIIGVNHFAIVSGDFYSTFEIPKPSKDLLNFIKDSRVGLETVGPDERIKLLKDFLFPWNNSFERQQFGIYNPLSLEYFNTLLHELPNSIPMLDADLLRRQSLLDSRYERLGSGIEDEVRAGNPPFADHFFTLFGKDDFDWGLDTDMEPEDAYDLLTQKAYDKYIDGEKIIRRFQVELVAQRLDRQKESRMLDSIITEDLDAIVVGLGHAVRFKQAGIDANYFIERHVVVPESHFIYSTFEELTLDKAEDAVRENAVLDWKLNFGEKPRDNVLLMGLYGNFSPNNYFEIIEKNNQLYWFSAEKEVPVKLIKGYTFKMLVPDGDRELSFDAPMRETYIEGKVNNYDNFVMCFPKSTGHTPFSMMRTVYETEIGQAALRGIKGYNLTSFKHPLPEDLQIIKNMGNLDSI